jgi:hypothetical protein
MAGIIQKGSDTHKLHLSLLAAEKADGKDEKKPAVEKAEDVKGPKIPERKTENK